MGEIIAEFKQAILESPVGKLAEHILDWLVSVIKKTG